MFIFAEVFPVLHLYQKKKRMSESRNLFIDNVDLREIPNENALAKLFGQYGALCHVRLIKRESLRATAFVNYLRFEDAAKALNNLDSLRVGSHRLRVEWAKSTPKVSLPVYVPKWQEKADYIRALALKNPNQVVVPEFNTLLPEARYLMDMTAQAVAKHGPVFEAIIMKREADNTAFKMFLEAPEGNPCRVYYQWRVYSLLQGDTLTEWRTAPFQIFHDGPVWFPPPCDVNKHLLAERPSVAASLSDIEREELFKVLRKVTTTVSDVFAVSSFILERPHVMSDTIEILVDSLTGDKTSFPLRLARLYVINDVLHNGRQNHQLRSFIGALQPKLPEIMKALYGGAMKAQDQQKALQLVDATVQTWEKSLVYPSAFVCELMRLRTSVVG